MLGSSAPTPTPEISVVIPTHNRSGLLRLALRSVLWQQDVDFEVIVVDDGSTDDTSEVVTSLGDPRIRLIRNDDSQGVSAARNRGIAEARGQWIAFLDDDDLWAPDKLASQLEAARSTGRTWVYVGAVNVSSSPRVVGGGPPLPADEILDLLRESNVVPGGCSGVIVTADALATVGPFDRGLQPLADWDLWIRLAATGPPACVPRPLVAYRVHAGNMSLDARRVESEFRIVSERHGGGNRAVLYRYLGWWAFRVRRRRQALRYFARGLLQRNARYTLRDFSGDLAYLTRDTLQAVRLPFGLSLFRRRVHPEPGKHHDWQAEGQSWVDRLLASTGGDAALERQPG
jgi:glycosyltransferase involved in cell wall biosynthesis